MKIINVENNKKKVYVQLNDIMMMMNLDSKIPTEVFDKVFSNVFIVTDENRFEFKEFVEPATVEFFEKCDWIPDFKYYKNMSYDEFIADGQTMYDEKDEIAIKWNAMSEKQRERNQDLLTRYKRLDFKVKSCAEILFTKQGFRVMPFPIVPDSDGFIVNNEDCHYIAQQGINPLQILISRKDGKPLDSVNEIIPMGLIQSAESILISDNLEHNQYFDEIENSRKLSDDNKYLVTTFKIIPKEIEHEETKNVEKNDNTNDTKVRTDKPKGLVKRIKNWLKK